MIFDRREQAESLFTDLFTILLEDEQFVGRMRNNNLSLHLIHTMPDVELHVAPAGVHPGPPPGRAAITVKMSCDTAHSLWSGSLLMPLALARGKVRIKGSVARVLEFVPMLRPAFDRYPELANQAGIPI